MSFHDVRFPEQIALGATGGPTWSTQIITTASGAEQRNAAWAQARGRWNVGTGLRSRADLQVLLAFFRARRGRAYGFRFKDWSDFQLDRQTIGTTTGSLATFQIAKTYVSGPASIARNITRPVAGTVRCWVDGIERSVGAGAAQFQVGTSTGIITLGSTLAALAAKPVEVLCEFDVPARFDTDDIEVSLRTYHSGEWANIPIIEVRA